MSIPHCLAFCAAGSAGSTMLAMVVVVTRMVTMVVTG